MASNPGMSASAIKVVELEAKREALLKLLAASSPPPAPAPVPIPAPPAEESASTIKARILEEKVAALEAEVAAPKSASVLRAEQAEAKIAALEARMEEMRRAEAAKSAPTKSDSQLRYEKAEAKAAKLEARLDEMHRAKVVEANASAAKSASVIRAEEKEAEVARLEAQLAAFKTGSTAASSGGAKPPLPPQPRATKPVGKDAKTAQVKGDSKSTQFDLAHNEMKGNVEKARPETEAAKSSIITIIDNVKKDHPKAKVRVGFVAYRDFCDGDKRLQAYPLTENIESVRKFIAACEAFGGGDEPEDNS
ncbi:hypothetical protein PHYSODRAFT_328458 [Phytophthora sojae]|uniref:Uncharacterized protein n=1 Tax=Phytophthora sojae (strain P6497) TaxID=1094619 RepID=G4Z6R8_PHYSP|nr:hypothetical protein PHYSODRAFT_328458 [Phytophthora sojae]EGZ20334.1 hypothetical protein PHYSODRAFT_328458 [Phytophthora sojae]|eukprot:XP_009523051.1 hypothetical protein PHYSODRAFT_328458 [Phytophthora sojae]